MDELMESREWEGIWKGSNEFMRRVYDRVMWVYMRRMIEGIKI